MVRKFYIIMLAMLIGASVMMNQAILAQDVPAACTTCAETGVKMTAKTLLDMLPKGSTVSESSFSNLIPSLGDLYIAARVSAPIVGLMMIGLGTRDIINGWGQKEGRSERLLRGLGSAAIGGLFIVLRLGAVEKLGSLAISVP